MLNLIFQCRVRELCLIFEYFWIVMFADEVTVDDAVPITRDKATATRHARKTVQMVDVLLSAHHKLTGGDWLWTGCTCAARSKHSAVVIFAEYHALFCIARGPDLPESSLTARTLETSCMPVPIHGIQQELLYDATATACTCLHFRSRTSSVFCSISSGHVVWLSVLYHGSVEKYVTARSMDLCEVSEWIPADIYFRSEW